MEKTPSLMELLKEDTRSAHDSAEGSRFQSALTSGNIPLESYKAYLEQIYLIHHALESSMQRNRSHPALNMVVSDVQYQEPIISQDLRALGVERDKIQPIEATKRFLREMEGKADALPAALLGYHYVLLGSKHGGKFVARNLQTKFNFENGIGCKYFDPYGGSFSGHWQEFKCSMNAISCSEAEQSEIVGAARAMFLAIQQICIELDRD